MFRDVEKLSVSEKSAVIQAWLVCIRLLGDEEEDLRLEVAEFVANKLPKIDVSDHWSSLFNFTEISNAL